LLLLNCRQLQLTEDIKNQIGFSQNYASGLCFSCDAQIIL